MWITTTPTPNTVNGRAYGIHYAEACLQSRAWHDADQFRDECLEHGVELASVTFASVYLQGIRERENAAYLVWLAGVLAEDRAQFRGVKGRG